MGQKKYKKVLTSHIEFESVAQIFVSYSKIRPTLRRIEVFVIEFSVFIFLLNLFIFVFDM